MKNTQLRTGNLVLYKGEVKTIDGILRGHICLLEHSKDGKYGEWIDLNEIEFIPLTEKNIIDFGATELVGFDDVYKRFNINGVHLSISPPDRDWFIEYVHQIPIKHVHTLQNFYFATKLEELIKTP